jgi:LPPG:FO 2-phospho-L-lactate transferase
LIGLARALPPADLTAIVNTADDAEFYGVHVSPDVDIVTYWLAGIADSDKGWGLRNDTFNVVDALQALGEDAWFRLGDRDMATCMFRTLAMRSGKTLTEATHEIRRRLGVGAAILPMSDDPVRTVVHTADGRRLEFQEYFVRERHEPAVGSVSLEGIETARPGPEVIEALGSADLVVVCPSNPVVSIGPILALPGARETLRSHPNVVAVSPIVRGAPLKGPADKLLSAQEVEVSAVGVAALYEDFCNTFVVDLRDEAQIGRIAGTAAVALDTIMSDAHASERLAKEILAL